MLKRCRGKETLVILCFKPYKVSNRIGRTQILKCRGRYVPMVMNSWICSYGCDNRLLMYVNWGYNETEFISIQSSIVNEYSYARLYYQQQQLIIYGRAPIVNLFTEELKTHLQHSPFTQTSTLLDRCFRYGTSISPFSYFRRRYCGVWVLPFRLLSKLK